MISFMTILAKTIKSRTPNTAARRCINLEEDIAIR